MDWVMVWVMDLRGFRKLLGEGSGQAQGAVGMTAP